MKYKKILTWACTAALFLTGCTTDTVSNGGWMDDSNAVRIQASAGSTLTRSNPIETDESKLTGFNRGDKISVSNRNITVNYTFDGEKLWVPENDKYLVWDKNDLTFEGYYPCVGKNSFSVGYIKKNQSTLEALAQSDYMNITYNVPEVPSDKHLRLELKRQTARLIFKIQKFNDEFSERVKVDKLEIDCPEKTNGETDDWDPITPYQIGNGGVGTTYTALVIPGVIYAKLNTSEKSYDSEGAPQALNLETGELKAGYIYTYNLIVGKNKVTVGGVTVAEWTPGTPLPEGVAEVLAPYVTMNAAETQTFKMTCAGNYTLPEDLEYSVNNGKWQKVEADQGVEFGGDLGSLRLRGICPNGTATSWEKYSTITFSDENVKVDCSGDIRTLINYTAHENVATENCSFISLFKNCKALRSAPQLPAKALKESCYRQMFEGCTSLEKAPKLPAKELDNYCYESMFKGCTSLTNAPELRATKIMEGCYKSMFEDCKKLIFVTMLATEYGYESLSGWLKNAGTEAANRILKVYDKETYNKIVTDYDPNMPDLWKMGKCTVWDKDGNKITK